MELSLLVANAVRERRPELELLVREQVDAELARLTEELVERELDARRNDAGVELPVAPAEESPAHHPEVEVSPLAKRCTRCGETKPLEGFPVDARTRDGRRTVCAACRARRRRELKAAKAADAEEPHPARGRTTKRGRLISAREDDENEQIRELLAELRSNGVEYVERDGRTFTVLHLPPPTLDRSSARVPIVPRRRRSIALA